MKSYEELIDKYPNLYSKCKYFECGIGWYDIIDNLSAKLEELILESLSSYTEMPIYASQVKEKYGKLSFYMSSATQQMYDLIDQAEIESSKICEICGKPGTLRKCHWFKTSCDDCLE